MAEQQPYDVIARRPGFELRRYPPYVVAELEVDGPFEAAATNAFRPLFGFINGRNRSRRQVTTPAAVGGSEKIAMTAPVIQQEGPRSGSYLVRFVMPANYTAETLPTPDDARVRTRQIPEQLTAAVRFSGRWTRQAFEQRAAALRDAVTTAGLRPAGPVQYARFNPPWTPWFLRRNEVLLPVEE